MYQIYEVSEKDRNGQIYPNMYIGSKNETKHVQYFF